MHPSPEIPFRTWITDPIGKVRKLKRKSTNESFASAYNILFLDLFNISLRFIFQEFPVYWNALGTNGEIPGSGMILLSTILAFLFKNTSVKGDFEINEQASSLNIWTEKNK